MSNVLNVLVENLNGVFKENDDKVLNDTIKWAFEMKEKIREFRKGDGTVRKNYFEECRKLQDECGSKKWFDVIDRAYSDELLIEKVKELHDDVIKKRNKNIASKLEKENITKVLSENVSYSNDGFHGLYVVETDKGVKTVKIQTIIAYGEVQRLHQRTLCKVLK